MTRIYISSYEEIFDNRIHRKEFRHEIQNMTFTQNTIQMKAVSALTNI